MIFPVKAFDTRQDWPGPSAYEFVRYSRRHSVFDFCFRFLVFGFRICFWFAFGLVLVVASVGRRLHLGRFPSWQAFWCPATLTWTKCNVRLSIFRCVTYLVLFYVLFSNFVFGGIFRFVGFRFGYFVFVFGQAFDAWQDRHEPSGYCVTFERDSFWFLDSGFGACTFGFSFGCGFGVGFSF